MICDRIWENPPYGIFRENRDRNVYQQYYPCSKFETDRVFGYAAFCAMTRELLNSRNYGQKVLLCARMRTTSARK